MKFCKSRHYQHLVMKKPNVKYEHKTFLVFGTTLTGKSSAVEVVVETLFEKEKCSIFFTFDVNDVYESAFAMFEASEKPQLEQLKKQKRNKEAKPVKIHCLFSLKGLEKEIREMKKKYKDGLLPEMDFIVLDITHQRRQETEFLMETDEDKGFVKLMVNSGNDLKKSDGMHEFKEIIHNKTKKHVEYYHGEKLKEIDPIADKKDERFLFGALNLFEKDKLLMPHNFSVTSEDGITVKPLNMREILEDKKSYHVFISKLVDDDPKLREYIVNHLLCELDRNMEFSPRPVVIVTEEIDTLSEFGSFGRKRIFDKRNGEMMKRIRKQGVTMIGVATEYTKTGAMTHSKSTVKLVFKLGADDMEKMKKIYQYTKQQIKIIGGLDIGEFVMEGEELRRVGAKVPKHSHKHHQMNFYEEYRKDFPEKLKDYSSLVKAMKEYYKAEDKRIRDEESRVRELKKRGIRRRQEYEAKKKGKEEDLQERDEKRKVEKKAGAEKRNEQIVKIYWEMRKEKGRVSSRKIAEELKERGIECNYKTVQNVLKEKGIKLFKSKKDGNYDTDNLATMQGKTGDESEKEESGQ